MKCKLCLGDKVNLLFVSRNIHGRHILGLDEFGVYECDDCGSVFTDVETNDEYYRKYYPDDYYSNARVNKLIDRMLSLLGKYSFRRRLKLIEKYKPEGNKLLEIGCAKGDFLRRLPAYFQKHGVEINPIGYQYIQEHYKEIKVCNVKIDSGSFNNVGTKYDIIVMWHVFEHIGNPNVFLKNVKKILSENGVVILEIPNRNSVGFKLTKDKWFHLDTPRHLFHYKYNTLKSLLNKYGFEIAYYSSPPFDYFHDLAVSIYKKLSRNNIINRLFLLFSFPILISLRMFLALFSPSNAEINTYIVKQS